MHRTGIINTDKAMKTKYSHHRLIQPNMRRLSVEFSTVSNLGLLLAQGVNGGSRGNRGIKRVSG